MFMEGLKVEHWHQWETLCSYFMSLFVNKNFGANINYVSYGSRGQNQFGIDLVAQNNNFPAVGQCKLKETSFTWKMLQDELVKTDSYAGQIGCYVLFTTANQHWSIQDKLVNGYYTYQRPSGTNFKVFVVHWSSIKNLDFIPRATLESIFPNAFKISMPSQLQGYTADEHLASLRSLRANSFAFLSMQNIEWLEKWDFSQGYVFSSDYDPILNLSIDYNRAVTAKNNHGLFSWLHEGRRALIAESMPAGSRLFSAIEQFTASVNGQIIGKTLPNNIEILCLEGIEISWWPKITNEWRSSACYVTQIYREDVLGAPQN